LTQTDAPLVSPTSIEAALDLLSAEGALAVAGGTSLALLLKNDLIAPDRLVSLRRVPQLSAIAMRDSQLRLGAMVSMRTLIASQLVRANAPALAQAASRVGNPRVRSMATIGGAITHADPRQDVPPVLLALGAHACLVGLDGERTVPMSEYFFGVMDTAARDDELITEVVVPVRPDARTVYLRFTPNSYDDYPVVGVAVAANLTGDGLIASARIAVGGVDSTAVLATSAADVLAGRRPDRDVLAAAAASAAAAVNPGDDRRGSPEYKRAMTEVWVRRALERCLLAPAAAYPPGTRPGDHA
jgi:aerobic carbon-monoxide dehydrogenase medium subunit